MISDNLLTILVVVGAIAYFLKYGKKQTDVSIMSELTSLLHRFELPSELADIIEKLIAGKSKEANRTAEIMVREFQNDEIALAKLAKSFNYQLEKRLKDPIELAKLKAEVNKATQALIEHSEKNLDEHGWRE